MVKMGQGLKGTVVYLLKALNSEQQERNKWQGQNGPRVNEISCLNNRVKLGRKDSALGLGQVRRGPFWLRVKLGQGVDGSEHQNWIYLSALQY